MSEVYTALMNAAAIVLVAIIGYIANAIAAYFKKEGLLTELANKQAYAAIVVSAVQQIYTEADGPEKLAKAKTQLVDYFNKHKINITEQELDVLIESAVKSLKKGVAEVTKETEVK